MKTIYLVTRAKSTSGPINQALNILNGMRMNGRVNSWLVTLEPEKEGLSWLQKFHDADMPVYQFNQSFFPTFFCVFKLRRYLKQNKIEVVHSSGFRANIVSLLSGTKAKKVITQRCHPLDIAEKFPPKLRPIISTFYMKLIKKADAVVACSKSIQNIFRDKYQMDIYAVQNGVNTSFFKPVAEEQKKELRKKLGLPIDKTIYLVLGTLIARKNNKVAVEAFKRLNLKDSVLLFVGEGNEESMLKELAANNPNIIFAGVTKTPLIYQQASDFLISCSLGEGLPNTVLEALSCGLPCILSDIGPHQEIIAGTKAGIIFSRDSVDDLCGAIMKSQEWDINEKSKNARNLAESNFSVNILAEKYERIYNIVLNEKGTNYTCNENSKSL